MRICIQRNRRIVGNIFICFLLHSFILLLLFRWFDSIRYSVCFFLFFASVLLLLHPVDSNILAFIIFVGNFTRTSTDNRVSTSVYDVHSFFFDTFFFYLDWMCVCVCGSRSCLIIAWLSIASPFRRCCSWRCISCILWTCSCLNFGLFGRCQNEYYMINQHVCLFFFLISFFLASYLERTNGYRRTRK